MVSMTKLISELAGLSNNNYASSQTTAAHVQKSESINTAEMEAMFGQFMSNYMGRQTGLICYTLIRVKKYFIIFFLTFL